MAEASFRSCLHPTATSRRFSISVTPFVQLTDFWEGVLFALPLATLSLAFLLIIGLLVYTDIKWALPGMKLMTIVTSSVPDFFFSTVGFVQF